MKNYRETLNRKTVYDNIAEGISNYSNSIQPINKNDVKAKFALQGFAAGFGRDRERERKLEELETQAKQISDMQMQLEMTAGKNQQIKANRENFFLTNRNDLTILNDYLKKGDFEAIDIMAPSLIESYKKITGEDIGEFAYSKNGKAYFENGNGQVKGIYVADLFQGIIPQEEQENFSELLTYNSKESVKNKIEEMRLKNELIRSQIASHYANANLHNAEALRDKTTGNDFQKMEYKSQLEQNAELGKSKIKTNNDFMSELAKENTKASNLIPVLDEFNKIVTTDPKLFGSGKWNGLKRDIAKFTGEDASVQKARFLQKYFFPEIKGIAGNPNQKEWVDLISRIISENQNVEAVKAQIKFEKQILQQKQKQYQRYSKILNTDNNMSNKYYYDPEIANKIKTMEEEENAEEIDLPDGRIVVK